MAAPYPADPTAQTPTDAEARGATPTWDDPIPLGGPELPPWPADVLPSPLGEYVAAVADAYEVPLDLPAMLALASLAVTCQRRVRIALGAEWQEPLSLYVCTILPPAELKSPVVAEMSAPLVEWECHRAEALRPALVAAQADLDVLERRAEAARKQAVDGGAAAEQAARDAAAEVEAARAALPRIPRLLADDATPERLAGLLAEHGGRMAVMSAEPTTWAHMSGRYSRDGRSHLEVYLQGHCGDTLLVDRMSRTEHVKRPALTLAICAQPKAVQGMLLTREFRGRGAVGRVLMVRPRPLAGYRPCLDRAIPPDLRAGYHAVICRLLDAPYGDEVRVLRIDAAARPRWLEYRRSIEPRLRPGGDLAEIPDWAGKLRGAVGRIAALLHLAEHAHDTAPWEVPMSRDTLDRAIHIGDYLIPHARAVYGLMDADGTLDVALRILGLIREMRPPTVTKRDLWRRMHGRLRRPADLDAPLALVVEHGYLRPAEREPGRGGRPSEVYDVHPDIQHPAGQKCQNPPDTPDIGTFGTFGRGVEDAEEVAWV